MAAWANIKKKKIIKVDSSFKANLKWSPSQKKDDPWPKFIYMKIRRFQKKEEKKGLKVWFCVSSGSVTAAEVRDKIGNTKGTNALHSSSMDCSTPQSQNSTLPPCSAPLPHHTRNQAFSFYTFPIFAITAAASAPFLHHWYGTAPVKEVQSFIEAVFHQNSTDVTLPLWLHPRYL